MSRPPRCNADAMMSMLRAICGRTHSTAAATLASSELMMRANCRDDFRSRSAEAGFAFSVTRRARLMRGFLATLFTAILQRFDDRIVKFWADLSHGFIARVVPGSIGEQR